MLTSGSPRRAASQSVVTRFLLEGGRVSAMVSPSRAPHYSDRRTFANRQGTRNHDQPHWPWLDHSTERRGLRKAPENRDFRRPRRAENPGFRRIELLRRPDDDQVEFVTVTWFDSLDAVKAFAGTRPATPAPAGRGGSACPSS